MAKWINDLAADASLNNLKNIVGTTEASACSAQPTTATEAGTTYMLAKYSTPAYTGPADGDASGRKLTIDASAGVAITNSGNATHIAIYVAAAALNYVTTCATLALTSGGTVNFPAWKIEIADPV
jgi:hypothetical protein